MAIAHTHRQQPAPRGAAAAPAFCDPGNRRWILLAAILASAMGFIDGSVVAIALPAMRASLGADLAQATWINNAYLLPLSALILVGGAAGDRYGVARVFKAGIALFVLASLAVALAPGPLTMIAARAVKGVAAAAMVPGSLAIIARAYPRAERGGAIGLWAAASAVTTAFGPVLGGALLSLGGAEAWRIVFALNLPLGALAFWILARKVGRDAAGSDDPLDWPGALLATLALGLGAWALTAGAGGPPARALALGGLLALAAFLAREARTAHPMMPLGLFRDRTFAAANLATFLLYFALSAVLFYLPQTVIAGWGRPAAQMSTVFVPFSAAMALLGPVFGRLADRVGPGPPIGAGAALVAAAFAGLALTMPMQSFWGAVLPLMALMGLGMSAVVSPLSAAVMGAAPDEATGAASGINNAVSRMAGLVAVASMGAVAARAYAAAGGGGAGYGAEGADPAAMNAAFAAVAWITAGMAAAAAAVALLLIRRPAGDPPE